MKKLTTRLVLMGATLALTLITSLSAAVAPASAQTAATSGCGQNLQCVIAFGDARIQERLAALNVLIGRVNEHAYLTSSQKAAIVSDATTNINGLNALKTQLDHETTVAAARTDVKNIYVNFRIFAVVLPRDYAEIWLDHQSNLHDTFVSLEPKVLSAINLAAGKGVNVTQEQAQYQDLVNKVNDDATQVANGQALIPLLIPANYPGTQQTFVTLRTDLKAGHADLLGAWTDLRDIVKELKAALGGSPAPVSTSTGTPAAGS